MLHDNEETVHDRMCASIIQYSLIGNGIQAFDWYRNWWRWL